MKKMVDGQEIFEMIEDEIRYCTKKDSDKPYSKIKAFVHIGQLDLLIQEGLIEFEKAEKLIMRIKKLVNLTDEELEEAHFYR